MTIPRSPVETNHIFGALVTDVRMPWFMLGVIYVGLFFLLANRKEKQQ